MPNDMTQMDRVANLCKRRGFVFPSAEIYGGLGGFWDWGPLGQKLKDNIKAAWWKDFVLLWDDVVGIDGAIITNPKVWEASGHTTNMVDLLVECKKCHHRFRDDEGILKQCPDCGGELTPPRRFNILFSTHVGPVEDSSSVAYLRGETCQNIFVNFENIRETMRLKVPFGIAQIGKAFRNEITPGNFVFRSREFEQMELEYFVPPSEAKKYFDEWVERSRRWLIDHGIKESNLQLQPHPKEKLAHYSKATTDIMYAFPFGKGWEELWGIANRGDYDLKQHGKMARGDELAFATAFKDDEPTAKEVPFVIEPSLGVERAALAFLLDAYDVVAGGRTTTTDSTKEEEVVLHLHPAIAPVKIAVLPLSKKPALQKIAHDITQDLRRHWTTMYDETGSIGRRYRRQDEIGTPYCLTVDFDTIEGGKRPTDTVTIRHRDTMEQETLAIHDLVDYFRGKLG